MFYAFNMYCIMIWVPTPYTAYTHLLGAQIYRCTDDIHAKDAHVQLYAHV